MKTALCTALASLLLFASASAQEDHRADTQGVEVGEPLVCDTRQQAERYIALYKGDQEAAVRAVNDEAGNPTACTVISATFVRGAHIGSAAHGNMAFEIVRILVLGVEGPTGFRAVRPAPYFTVFGVTEYPV